MVQCLKIRQASKSPLQRGSLFYFGFFGVIGMFGPFVNVYLRESLDFNGWQIGLLSTFGPLMALLVAIPVASLADQRQWRIPLLIWSILGFAGGLSLYGFIHSFAIWAILGLVTAILFSPAMPLADSMIARMSLRHQLNYGTMRLYGSIGFAVMAILCGAIWEYTGFRVMFIASGLAFVPVAYLAVHLEEEPAAVTGSLQTTSSFWTILRDSGLTMLVIASFFMGAALYMIIVFDGIYMTWLGGTESWIGLMFGFSAFNELPAMHYRDRIAQRFGGPATLLLSYGLFFLVFVGYMLAHSPWMLLSLVILRGWAYGLCWVSTVRLTNERAPKDLTATAQSIMNASFYGIAPLLASPIGGVLYDRFGPRSVFVFAGVLVGMAAAVMAAAMFRGVFTETKTPPLTMQQPLINQSV